MSDERDEWIGQWFTGWVTCEACGDRHVTVQPVCVERGECPKCGAMACVSDEEMPDTSVGALDGERVYPVTAHRSVSGG